MQFGAHGSAMLCFGALCFTSEARTAMVLLTLAVSVMTFSTSGATANVIDICGGRADETALLMGVINTVGTLPGILASKLAGVAITGQGTQEEWARVFGVTVCVISIALCSFLRFAQGHDVFSERSSSSLQPSTRGREEAATVRLRDSSACATQGRMVMTQA